MRALTTWLASSILAGAAVACSEPRSHVLVGYLFDPVNMCVNPPGSIEIVDGPAPGAPCPASCVLDTNRGNLYVTTMCPPYPLEDTPESADAGDVGDGGDAGALLDPNCVNAVAAFANGSVCGVAAADAGADGAAACPEGGDDGTGDEATGDGATGDGAPADGAGDDGEAGAGVSDGGGQ